MKWCIVKKIPAGELTRKRGEKKYIQEMKFRAKGGGGGGMGDHRLVQGL
jgi:hypothetical protein